MKKWVTPELIEMKASLTKNHLGYTGGDSYGESTPMPDGSTVTLGPDSCC